MTIPAAPATAPAPALAPRSVPQIFDAILGIARHHAWDLFALSFLFHLPVHVFRIAGALAGPASAVAGWDPQRHIGAAWWVLWNTLAVGACAVATCQLFLDGDTSVRRAIEGMQAGARRLVVAILLYGLLVNTGEIVSGFFSGQDARSLWIVATLVRPFGLLSFVVLVYGAPMIPASFAEHRGAFAALLRAFALVRQNSWRVAGTVWILWIATYYADDGLVRLVAGMSPTPAVPAVTDWAVDAALYPLRGIALAVLYFDCRVRNEGYDVERLLGTA